MLLKHLYDFAVSRKLLDDLAFAPKAVRWIIELDAEGNLVGAGPQATGDDKRGKEFSCPQTTRPKVAGGVSEFLADGLTAIFGLDPDPEAVMPEKKRADRDANNIRKREDFWQQMTEAAAQTKHTGLEAVCRFSNQLGSAPPPFLRWGKTAEGKPRDKSAWWLRTASGGEVRFGPESFMFRVNGELLVENESIRQFWRDRHADEVREARSSFATGLCLVSGRTGQPLAPTHNPKIQRVPNTDSFGAALVSFDKDAFRSFGFTKSLNAPTSEEVATAYCVALNWLLERRDHSIRIGNTCLCFWAQKSESSNSLFERLLNRPDPKSVGDFLKSPWAGIERDLAKKDQFFVVTFAGNPGRITVRHWLQQPLDQAIENFHEWFADLELRVPERLQPKAGTRAKAEIKVPPPPLAVLQLARMSAPLTRKAGRLIPDDDKLAPEVSAQLYRTALEGTAPSISLIRPILNQLHSRLVRDENYNLLYDESRFALLKLILNRNRKDTTMEIKPELTADTDDAAYNCGRLLTVFDDLQQRSHEWKLEGATVAERYYGSASTTPSTAFGILWRLHLHHLKKLRGLGGKHEAAAHAIEQKITDICALVGQTPEMKQRRLPPSLPRTLDLQAQGRFALGYYQQKAEAKAAQAAHAAKAGETLKAENK